MGNNLNNVRFKRELVVYVTLKHTLQHLLETKITILFMKVIECIWSIKQVYKSVFSEKIILGRASKFKKY